MRTLILDPPTAGLEEVLERRRRSGLDRLDEVWEGVLHMVPVPSFEHAEIAQRLAELMGPPARAAGLLPVMHEVNIGQDGNYRIPDGSVHRPGASGVWHPTAAIVIEVASPGDETWEKMPFYAEHAVDEVLIVDPEPREVHWLALAGDDYKPAQGSALMELAAADVRAALGWG